MGSAVTYMYPLMPARRVVGPTICCSILVIVRSHLPGWRSRRSRQHGAMTRTGAPPPVGARVEIHSQWWKGGRR